MKRLAVVTWLICLTLGWISLTQAAPASLTYIYGDREPENRCKDCQRAWGLVTLIEFDGQRILFDTGGDPAILEKNMKTLGLDPASLDLAVVSHQHWEMPGGVSYLVKANPKLKVISTDWTLEDLDGQGIPEANLKEMDKTLPVTPNIILMKLHSRPMHGGPMGIDEIHVMLKTTQGLVILQGCGHTEVLDVVPQSQAATGEKRVYMVSGGLHLLRPGKTVKQPDGSNFTIPSLNYSDAELEGIADKLKAAGVQKIVPTHCTGSEAEKIFEKKWGAGYINQKLGLTIELPAPLPPTAQTL